MSPLLLPLDFRLLPLHNPQIPLHIHRSHLAPHPLSLHLADLHRQHKGLYQSRFHLNFHLLHSNSFPLILLPLHLLQPQHCFLNLQNLNIGHYFMGE